MGIVKVFLLSLVCILLTYQGAFATEGVLERVETSHISSERNSSLSTSELKQPERRLTPGDIRRYVTAKTSLFRVLRAATLSGVNTRDLMQAIFSTSASPADIIYVAIVEGYPVGIVVEEAIMVGVSAEVVFSSALAAGASRVAIAKAMVELGASAVDVADALAKVTTTKKTLP